MNGRLLKSTRSANRTRSRTYQLLPSANCIQLSPGDSKVFLPSVPAVNGAGYAKASIRRYGFCAAVGRRFGAMAQSGVKACSMGANAYGRDAPGKCRFVLPAKVTV